MPLATYNTYPDYTYRIKFPPSFFTGAWVVNPAYLSHEKNVKNSIKKLMSGLDIGGFYRVTYEVFDYVDCTVQLKVGGQLGQVASADGFYSDNFQVNTSSDKLFEFISDGILKIRGITIEKREWVTEDIPFSDTTQFENHSWTISYSFHSNSWISWHSYLPNYYIYSQNNFYSFIAGTPSLFRHNKEGNFQTFYGVYHPYIIEYVPASNLNDKIFEDLTLHTKARRFNSTSQQYLDERFITFNKIVVYNNRQCSGELVVKVKDTQANPENWFQQQIVNEAGFILATRAERNWNLNEFRDNIVSYTKPFFTTEWNAIKLDYYIDKVVDGTMISFFKEWNELESFRDKYIIIRLKFDIFDDVNLILNYSLETESNSYR